MAFLIYTNRENLYRSIADGLIRIPQAQKNRFDLNRIKEKDNLFLLDYESWKLFGPFKSLNGEVKEEKGPRSGPFNGLGTTRDHFRYQSMLIDCSALYRRGVSIHELSFDVVEMGFFVQRERENFILEKLKFLNGEAVPLIIDLSLSDCNAEATVVEIRRGTSISSYTFTVPDNLFSLLETKSKSTQDLLQRGRARDFSSSLKDIGKIIYTHIFLNLNLEKLFKVGGYAINITGDGMIIDIPFEVAFHGSFIFEHNILTFRGKNEFDMERSRISRALILADPSGRYEMAHREAVMLYELFRTLDISTDLISRPLQKEVLIDLFAEYDIVHFCGHSVAGDSAPGWDIGTSIFSAHDLIIQKRLPYLVFSSSCGNTLKMGLEFLRLGIRNCICSRWQIPDTDLTRFILLFYYYLFRNREIGYAFNRALTRCYHAGEVLPITFVLQGENRVLYEKQNTRSED